MDALRLAGKVVRSLTFWNARRIWYLTRTQGPMAVLERARFAFGDRESNILKELEARPRELARQRRTLLPNQPRVALVAACLDTPLPLLRAFVQSVLAQTYSNWQLCLAAPPALAAALDDIVSPHRERIVLIDQVPGGAVANLGAAAARATGDFIGIASPGDILLPAALYELMAAVDSETDFLYADESLTDDAGVRRLGAILKPDFAPDTLRGSNIIGRFTLLRRDLWEAIGGLDPKHNAAHEYDLILRASERARRIAHVPKVLSLRRASAPPEDAEANLQAVIAHLARCGMAAEVVGTDTGHRIRYAIAKKPLVSILIPNKDQREILETCLASIRERTTYANIEILIIENNSESPETFAAYEALRREDPRIRVVTFEGPFNFSNLVNFGAQHAAGEFLLLLNNDTEVISPDWIERMMEFGQRDDVGAVGAKLLYPNDRTQHAGVVVGIQGIAGHVHRGAARTEPGYLGRLSTAQNLSAVTGACLLVRTSLFRELGGFDPAFAVAYNDVDFCLRIRDRGKLIVWTPEAELYHHESLTRGSDESPENRDRNEREIALFQTRWRNFLRRGDPYYNRNLSLLAEDCRVATPFDGMTLAYPVD